MPMKIRIPALCQGPFSLAMKSFIRSAKVSLRVESSSRLSLLADGGDRGGVLEGGEIAEIGMTEIRTTNHAAQDLGVAGLREVGPEPHVLRPERPAQPLGDRIGDLARQLIGP